MTGHVIKKLGLNNNTKNPAAPGAG